MQQNFLRILRAFDACGRATLDLNALASHLAEPPAALRATVAQLVQEGFLRSADSPDEFRRTEAALLALAGPRDATLYTRRGCHLCDDAKAVILPLLREFGGTLREVDVDSDPALRDAYSNDVPVIFLGSRKVAKHRVDPRQFRRQLASS